MGSVNPEVVTVGDVVVQTTLEPIGPLTVHNIDPAGIGLVAEVPATRAVRVVTPPRVGELDALKLIVGTRVEIPRVTEFEVIAV